MTFDLIRNLPDAAGTVGAAVLSGIAAVVAPFRIISWLAKKSEGLV